MPSTVVISCPSIATPRARHESTGRPSTSTAQHPHSPSSQPCLVPVNIRSSRSTSKSVLCGANATSSCSPFTCKRRCAFSSLFFAFFLTFMTFASSAPYGSHPWAVKCQTQSLPNSQCQTQSVPKSKWKTVSEFRQAVRVTKLPQPSRALLPCFRTDGKSADGRGKTCSYEDCNTWWNWKARVGSCHPT